MSDAERTHRRSQTLYERKVVSAQDLDRDRYTYIASKATLARVEAELRQIKTTWEKDRLTARAAVTQAKAHVENVQVNLARLVVRSAIDGRVLRVGVRPGQFAGTAWNEPLVVLGDSSDLIVRADVDESALPQLRHAVAGLRHLEGSPRHCPALDLFRHRAGDHLAASPRRGGLRHQHALASCPPGALRVSAPVAGRPLCRPGNAGFDRSGREIPAPRIRDLGRQIPASRRPRALNRPARRSAQPRPSRA